MSGKKPANSATQHLVSGGLSGFTAVLALQPLDLVKTRVQQDVASGKRQTASNITKEIYAQNGVFGLWRGTMPTLARNVPGVAIYFYTLQALRQEFTKIPMFAVRDDSTTNGAGSALPKLSSRGNLVAGVTARLGVGLLLNPFAVLKARYESDRYAYTSMSEATLSIYRDSGFRGLVQGFNASALRDAPFAGLYVLFYEAIKDRTSRLAGIQGTWLQSAVYTFSGASAGAMATLVTHPFDVMKTRMQVNSDNPEYRTLAKTIKSIYRTRGLMGFLDGASLRVSRKIGSSAISWTVYETLLMFWRDSKQRTSTS